MAFEKASPAPAAESARRTLTTWKILILTVAAITPLAAVVTTLPLGLAFGGPSMVWGFVITGVIIGFFSIGYSQMAQRISRPGAFYVYISKGLGKHAGVGAAFVAALGYTMVQIGAFAIAAVFGANSLRELFGLHISWQVFLIVQTLVIVALAVRNIDLSARSVAAIVAAELLLIVVLAVAVIVKDGIGDAMPASTWSFHVFDVGQWDVAFLFAALCWVGFEAAALYAPETKRPEKTIPRSLYLGALVLTVVLAFAAWILVGVTGVDHVQSAIEKQGLDAFVYDTTRTYLGAFAVKVLSFLVLLSQFASSLAATNFTGRYIESLAGDDLLPKRLAGVNRFYSPGRAIVAQGGVVIAVPLVLAPLGVDPYLHLSSVTFSAGTVGGTVLQALASAAVVGYFLRRPRSDRHWWRTFAAPVLATVLLAAVLYIEVRSFSMVTGLDEPWISSFPWVFVLFFVGGLVFAEWLRRRRPDSYADLAEGDTPEGAEKLRTRRLSKAAPNSEAVGAS
ncbi:APC family permease [Streptomyces sp. NPDC006356]